MHARNDARANAGAAKGKEDYRLSRLEAGGRILAHGAKRGDEVRVGKFAKAPRDRQGRKAGRRIAAQKALAMYGHRTTHDY